MIKKTENDEIFILIDNDELIILSWQRAAIKKSKVLFTFSCVEEFIAKHGEFSKHSQVFIDSELDNGLRGEVEARKIFDLGFENIFLATGFSKCDVNVDGAFWIKDIVGKKPPF